MEMAAMVVVVVVLVVLLIRGQGEIWLMYIRLSVVSCCL